MNHVLIKSSHTSLRVIHLTTKVTSVLTLYVNASRGSKNKKYPFIRNPRIFPTTSSSACEIHKIVMIFIGGTSSSLSPIGNGSVIKYTRLLPSSSIRISYASKSFSFTFSGFILKYRHTIPISPLLRSIAIQKSTPPS